MNAHELPQAVTIVLVVTSVSLAAAVAIAVRTLAHRPGVLGTGADDRAGAARIAAADRWLMGAVAIWSAPALLVNLLFPTPPAFVVPAIVGGLVAGGYLLVTRTDTGRRLLVAAPQPWLVGVQVYRVVGGVFLIAAAVDVAPAYFALPAGRGDLFVGVTALAVAGLWAVASRAARPATWAWNAIGLLDLAIAFGIGSALLARPAAALFGGSAAWLDRAASGFHPLSSSIFPMTFPLALIPTFVVPLSILLHFLSLRKLAAERREARRGEAFGIDQQPLAAPGAARG